MNQKDRASVIEAFGKPSTAPKVLLISLKAGGTGLNLFVMAKQNKYIG